MTILKGTIETAVRGGKGFLRKSRGASSGAFGHDEKFGLITVGEARDALTKIFQYAENFKLEDHEPADPSRSSKKNTTQVAFTVGSMDENEIEQLGLFTGRIGCAMSLFPTGKLLRIELDD